MAGGSNGYRVALVRRRFTPGLISSLPGTAGLPPFISFLTSYPELPFTSSVDLRRPFVPRVRVLCKLTFRKRDRIVRFVRDPTGILAARQWHRRSPVAGYPLRVPGYESKSIPTAKTTTTTGSPESPTQTATALSLWEPP